MGLRAQTGPVQGRQGQAEHEATGWIGPMLAAMPQRGDITERHLTVLLAPSNSAMSRLHPRAQRLGQGPGGWGPELPAAWLIQG